MLAQRTPRQVRLTKRGADLLRAMLDAADTGAGPTGSASVSLALRAASEHAERWGDGGKEALLVVAGMLDAAVNIMSNH